MKRLALVVLAGTAAASASAECVNPGGTNGCYSSIQAAVNAVGPGGRVVVQPGTYLENVVIPAGKDGMVLTGTDMARRPNTILDPDAPNSGVGITIQSDNVTVRLLKIRNGATDAIAVEGHGALISQNNIVSPESDGIRIGYAAINTRIQANIIQGAGSEGVGGDGDNDGTVLTGNFIGPCDSGCVDLAGDNVRVTTNRIYQSEDDDCLYVDGDNAQVRQNTMQTCDGEGVDVDGDLAIVAGNTITATDGGIEVYGINPQVTGNIVRGSEGIDVDCVSCTGGLVQNNNVTDLPDDEEGINVYADAPGLVVAFNVVQHAADEGYYVSGTGIRLTDNQANGNGGDNYEPGFEIYGSQHQILRNRANGNVEHGFYISASDSTVSANIALNNMGDGFEISGSNNVVNANQSIGNAGEGFQAGGTTNTFTNNVARRNRVDYCETSGGHTLSGNSFPTTGACEIDN